MRTHPLALPSGRQVIVGPLSSGSYFSEYMPLAGLLDERLKQLGGWAPLVLDELGWELLGQVLALVPVLGSRDSRLKLEHFGEEWWRIPPLLTEVLPELHKLPELEFKRLTASRGEPHQVDDPLVSLLASCPESISPEQWLEMDPATLHQFQWVRNRNAFDALPDKTKGEIAKAELFDQVRNDAKSARQRIMDDLNKKLEGKS